MRKCTAGVPPDRVRDILQAMNELGLGVHVNLLAAFPGDTPRELNEQIEFCLDALRDMRRATFTLNRFVLFPGTPVANQPGEFGVVLDGAAGDMPSHYDYHLTPQLQADETAVDGLVAAGQERLFTELGWRNLGTGPGRGGRRVAVLRFRARHPAEATGARPVRPVAFLPSQGEIVMARVFLTGATGNAGQPVLAELLRRGHEVTAMVRRPATLDGCRTVLGDLADIRPLADDVARAEAIIHLASPRSNDRDVVLRDDVRGTGELLDLWQRGNFVYTSSQTVYGIPRQTLTENSPLDASCWYDLGKICNEFQMRLIEADCQRGEAVRLAWRCCWPPAAGGPIASFWHDLRPVPRGAIFVFDSEEGLESYGSNFLGEEDFGLRGCSTPWGFRSSGPYNRRPVLHVAVDGRDDQRACGHEGPLGDPWGAAWSRRVSFAPIAFAHRRHAFARATGFTPRQTLEEVVARLSRWNAGRFDTVPSLKRCVAVLGVRG